MCLFLIAIRFVMSTSCEDKDDRIEREGEEGAREDRKRERGREDEERMRQRQNDGRGSEGRFDEDSR